MTISNYSPIATAPKDRAIRVVASSNGSIRTVTAKFDAEWGLGRGAWFTPQGLLVVPVTWKPRQSLNEGLITADLIAA